MKKFNSQICTTKEQSQRLLDLGLNPETADCQYAALVVDWEGRSILNPKWRFYGHNKGFIVQNFEHMERIPAWSLHRLMELLDSPFIEFLGNPYKEIIYNISECVKYGYLDKEYLNK